MTTLEEQMRMMPDVAYAGSRAHGNTVAIHFFSNPSNRDWSSAMGGPGYATYTPSDISDMLEDGAILDARTGKGYAKSPTALSGAQKVQASYDAFCRTYAGSRMIQQMGKPAWDAYAVGDLGSGAMAACISQKNRTRILAWNKDYGSLIDAGLLTGPDLERAVLDNLSRYGHVFGNPDADPTVVKAAAFYEAMRHEAGHYAHFNNIFDRPVGAEEYQTYLETAQFYRQLAEETKDSNYAMSKFYEAIAESSEKKASMYSRDSQYHNNKASDDQESALEQALELNCDAQEITAQGAESGDSASDGSDSSGDGSGDSGSGGSSGD